MWGIMESKTRLNKPAFNRSGIRFRQFLMLMTLSIVIILFFALMTVSQGKKIILNGLNAQSRSLSASIAEVCGNAFISGDYSFVVDHNMQVIKGAADIKYIIIVKKDGFSMVHTGETWEQRDKPDPKWKQVAGAVQQGRIISSDIVKHKVYHYTFPLQFSGIDWGFLHIGLSLSGYESALRTMYQMILFLGLFCFVIAAILSFFFARRLTLPILLLRDTADRIVQGDLTARANISSGDEVEELASSFNRMTDTILKSQTDIAAAHDYTQNILRSMAECLIVLKPDQTIEMVNKATLELLGYKEEDLIGKPVEIVFDQYNGFINENGKELLSQKSIMINREESFITKEGKVIPVLFSASSMQSREGSPPGIVCIALDITERKKAEKMLEKSRQEAISSSRAKSEFLANMSHEIRTPMNGVLGMIDLLIHTDLSVEQKRFADTANTSAKALLNLINDILDLSKIEAGKMEIEHVEFDLREKLKEVIDLFSIQARSKNIDLRYITERSVSSVVRGDPARIRQVLVNLVGNAIKFTDSGEVTVRVKTLEEPDQGILYRFEVTDTGIGINPEARQRIFDSFTQVDTSTTRKHGGTGLGLSISQQLVKLMNGTIGVESEPGKGSTFFFTIPLAETTGKTDGSSFGQDEYSGNPEEMTGPDLQGEGKGSVNSPMPAQLHILVAEDNAVNLQVVLAMLDSLHYRVDVASNGQEAVDAFSRQHYDVILMDCQMPEMDGYAATKIIREREKGSPDHTPIIALTGHAMQGDRETCLASGMDDFLPKPFNMELLFKTINRWTSDRPAEGGDSETGDKIDPASSFPKELEIPGAIDKNVLNSLRGLQQEGEPDLVGELITLYLAEASKILNTLDEFMQAKDAQGINKMAHKLKSSSASVGATNFASLLKQAEIMGRQNQTEEAAQLFPEICREYAAVRMGLEAELAACHAGERGAS